MIHANRIVTVGEQESIIDRPIVLYRGDREVEIEFTLVGNEFTFSEEGNVIKSVNASHGQLVLNTPSGEHMFSELAECHEGKVVFVVTKEMIDEFIEMGFYSFQIRLYDSAEMKSRVTIPPVMNGFDIRNPIAAEDETNVVDQGIVDYARIFKDQSNEELPTFTWDGEYVKTEWVHHDVITENKMNKIEDALYSINANIKESDVVMLNTLDQVKKDADKYVKDHMAEVEADVEEFERNLNTDVQKFKVDTNAAMTAHKNEVSEELELLNTFDERVTRNTNAIHYVTPEMFGYVHGEDSTQALNDAIKYCRDNGAKLVCDSITLFADVDFRRIKLEINGTLDLQTFICKLGNNSAQALGPDQYVHNVDQATTDYQLKILGAKGQHITINEAPYLKFEMSPAATESSMAYSRFDFIRISHIWIGNSSAEDTGTLWFNENVINLRRCGSFKMEGTYHHNNNIIIGGTFEGSSVIELDYATNNVFKDIRFEGEPKIICHGNASHNYFFTTWISYYRRASVTMTNEGVDNKVIYSQLEPRFYTYEIDTADYSDGHFHGVTYNEEDDTLNVPAWKSYFVSPFMPYVPGTTMYAAIIGGRGMGRVGIDVYDENFNKISSEITDDNTWALLNGAGALQPGKALPLTNYGFDTNTLELRKCYDDRVKYVTFRIYSATTYKFKRLHVRITAANNTYYA